MRTRTRRVTRVAAVAVMAAALLPAAFPAQAAAPSGKQKIINASYNKCLLLKDYDVQLGKCSDPKAVTSWELRDAGQDAVKIAGYDPQSGDTGCVVYGPQGDVFFGRCDLSYGAVWKMRKIDQGGEYYQFFTGNECLEANNPFDVKLSTCSGYREQLWRLESA
ncbi:hypothetical protein [Kitasatospora kifunensis]|uniref:Ricin B lectin domain-containing protein n=1 Tax=Kitasatospora kifunensis TaxID=58351 RepID=A0A7W7R708_KITKI|nr:hypothetical protein [Kitasatospora kifunensis]MBB4926529.1 hypothetical protein [Kitasatospora kifunensis]